MMKNTDVSNHSNNYPIGVPQNRKLSPSIKVGSR